MRAPRRTGKLDGFTFEWLDEQARGLFANCDKCHAKVRPNEPRMRLHDGQGRMRSGSKGTESSYWCVTCAEDRGIHPPAPIEKWRQGGLFDE